MAENISVAQSNPVTTPKEKTIAYHSFFIAEESVSIPSGNIAVKIPEFLLANLAFKGLSLKTIEIPADVLTRDTLRNSTELNAYEKVDQFKVNDNFIKSNAAQYILYGSVRTDHATFDLSVRIKDVKHNKLLLDFDTSYLARNDLPDIIKIVSDRAYTLISNSEKDVFRVAVLRFSPLQKVTNDMSQANISSFAAIKVEDLVCDYLAVHGNFQVAPFEATKHYSTSNLVIKNILDSGYYDVVIGGYYNDNLKSSIKLSTYVYSTKLGTDSLLVASNYVQASYVGDIEENFSNKLRIAIEALKNIPDTFRLASNKRTFEEEMEQGMEFFRAQKFALAMLTAGNALEKAGDDPRKIIRARNLLGQLNIVNQTPVAAIQHFSFSYALDSGMSNIEALHGIGAAEVLNNNYKKGIYYLNRLLSFYPAPNSVPDGGMIYSTAGVAYYYLDSLEKAKKLLKMALDIQPRRTMANYVMVKISLAEYNTAALETYISNLKKSLMGASDTSLLEKSNQAIANAIKTCIARNELGKAEALAIIVCKQFPTTDNLTLVTRVLTRQNKLSSADYIIQAGIASNLLKEKDIYKNIGLNLRTTADSNGIFNTTDYNNAIYYFKKHAASFASADADIYRLLGSSYFRLGNYDSALAYYTIMKETVNHPVNYLNLAELQVMMHRHKDAARTLKECNNEIEKIEVSNFKNYYHTISLFLAYANCVMGNGKNCENTLEQLAAFVTDNYPDIKDWSFSTFKKWVKNDPKPGVDKIAVLHTIDRLESL